MKEWTDVELTAMQSFINTDSIVRSALEKFLHKHRDLMRAQCAMHMTTTPHDPELAGDCAAKAQAYDELFALLTEELD